MSRILGVLLATLIVVAGAAVSSAETPEYAIAPVDDHMSWEAQARPSFAAPLAAIEAPSRSAVDKLVFADIDIQDRMNAYGYDESQAKVRLRIEEAVTGLNARALEAYEDLFAGTWITDGPEGPRVAIGVVGTSTALRDFESEAVPALFAYPEYVDVVLTEFTHAELYQAHNKVIDGLQPPAWASGMSTALDTVNNRIRVTLETDSFDVAGFQAQGIASIQTGLRAVAGIAAVDVEIGPPSTDVACSRTNCQWTMRGGLALDRAGIPACTSGFNLGLQQGGGPPLYYVSTAGHCIAGIGQWYKNGPNGHYGKVSAESWYNNGDEDAEVVSDYTLDSRNWVTEAKFIGDDTSNIRNVTSVACWNCYVIGQWVGASGRHGTTKGPIAATDTSHTTSGKTIREMVDYAWCITGWGEPQDGDSGAATFRNTTAMGILKGKNPICTAWFSRQINVEQAFGMFTLSS